MRIDKLTWMTGICVCGMTGVTYGEIRTFAMEGMIASKDDPVGALDLADVGARVVFTFSFDSDTPDVNSTPTLGEYYGLSSNLLV